MPKARTPRDVGDRVGVPALGQHRDRDDAAEGFTEAILLADGVHHLAQQVLVGNSVPRPRVAGAFDDFPSEALDLVRGHVAELLIERLAGFQLFGVDQQRARPGQPVAVFIVVPESASRPFSSLVEPSSFLRSKPEMKS